MGCSFWVLLFGCLLCVLFCILFVADGVVGCVDCLAWVYNSVSLFVNAGVGWFGCFVLVRIVCRVGLAVGCFRGFLLFGFAGEFACLDDSWVVCLRLVLGLLLGFPVWCLSWLGLSGGFEYWRCGLLYCVG